MDIIVDVEIVLHLLNRVCECVSVCVRVCMHICICAFLVAQYNIDFRKERNHGENMTIASHRLNANQTHTHAQKFKNI